MRFWKKSQTGSLMDIVIKLEYKDYSVLKEKKLFEKSEKDEYVSDSSLTLKGELIAKM